MPKNPTELAATWPPTAAVSRGAGHRPMSPLKTGRLLVFPTQRNPALRGRELRPLAVQGR